MDNGAYYRFLATTFSTTEIASAFGRRVRHRLRKRLSTPPDRLGARELREALGVGSAADVSERCFRPPGALRFDGPFRSERRAALAARWPELPEQLVLNADRILAGELHLFGRWRDHARGELAPGVAAIAWSRDPLGGPEAPNSPSKELDRDRPGLDARAIWEAARLAPVLWLAAARFACGLPGTERALGAESPELYVRAAALHLRDFLVTQPVGIGLHWTCAMEAALRAIHLAIAATLLRGLPGLDALFWEEVAVALRQHGAFIEAELEDDQLVPGNHLLTDLAGLVAISSLAPGLPESPRWRAQALPAFQSALLAQTSREGLSFEASMPYHRFVTELGWLVRRLTEETPGAWTPAATQRLEAMTRQLDAARLSDGLIPNLGDNDSSAALSLLPRSPLDPTLALALSQRLVSPETTLLFGDLNTIPSVVEPVAGPLAVLHGSDGRSASLWAGDHGQHGLGGHAHNDELTVEVCLGGRRIVHDGGCPTYLRDPALRDRHRSARSHATLLIDGEEPSPIPENRPFLLPAQLRAELLVRGDREAVGERRPIGDDAPWRHRRSVALPEGVAAVLITDRLLGRGVHRVELRWPTAALHTSIASAGPRLSRELERLESLASGEGRFARDQLVVLEGDGAPVVVACAAEAPFSLQLEASERSPGYGERLPGTTVSFVFRVRWPFVATTAFFRLPHDLTRDRAPPHPGGADR